jgi:hypothetical protein
VAGRYVQLHGLPRACIDRGPDLDDEPANSSPGDHHGIFVEGYTEEIGAETYTIDFNLSPATLSPTPWILNSASYSQLDSTTVSRSAIRKFG